LKITKLILKGLKNRSQFFLFVTILITLFGYIYRQLFNWRMLAIGDLASWYLTPSDALVDMQSAWMTKGLGGPRSSAPGEAVIQAFMIYLFGNASMAQRIFYLFLLPLSAIAMYAFLNYMKCSKITKIVISITYAINGITIPWWQGGIFGLFIAHIVFPVAMLYLLKILENGESRVLNVLMLAIFFGFLTSLWQQGFLLLVPFITIFSLVEIAYKRNIGYASRIALSFVLFSVIFSLLMLPYLVTLPYMFGEESSVLPSRWSIEEELKNVQTNYTLGYTVQMFNSFDFFMLLFTVGLFFVNKTKKKHYLSMLLTGSLILLFSHLTMQGATLNLFALVPYLLLFRSPERIGFMIFWSFLSMTALLADDVEKWINRKRVRFPKLKFLLFLLLFGLIFSAYLIQPKSNIQPPFNNTTENAARFFSEGTEPSLDDVGEVDPIFEEISLWLSSRRQTEGFFRTLWLPSERFMNAKVLFRYDPWQISLFARNPYLDPMGLSLMPLIENKTENFGELLSYFNVKYLIVVMKEWTKWSSELLREHYTGTPRLVFQKFFLSYAPAGDPKAYVDLLNKQKDLSLIVDDADFKIYKNEFFVSHISAYNKIFLIAYPNSWSLFGENETVLADDNQTAFWGLDNLDEGNVDYSITNNNLTKTTGIDSLEVNTTNGAHSTFRLYHDYSSPEDFSSFKFVVFLFYVNNSGSEFRINFFTTYPEPRAEYSIVDNYIGWKTFVIPFNKFKIVGNGFSWANISKIEIDKTSKNEKGTWYFDRFILSADPSFYRYPEDIPFQYLSSKILTQVPNMLSTLPFYNPNQTLLLFESFQSSKDFDAYRNLSDVVVFLEEPKNSLVRYDLMNCKGNHTRTFFIYEAESLLFSAEKNSDQSYQSIEITGWPNDNQTALWTLDNLDSGTNYYSISNNNATNSLKVNTVNGAYGTFRLWHEFPPVNFSSADFVSLDFNGSHSGATFKIFFMNYPDLRAEYTFTDDVYGLRRIIIPKNDFSIVGNGFSWANISKIEIDKTSKNEKGIWYFGKLSFYKHLDNQYKVRHIVEASWLSNNQGVILDNRGILKNIAVPETSYYRIMMRATDTNLALSIDGRSLNFNKINNNGNNLSWVESEPINLDRGEHMFSFSDEVNQTILDQIVMFPIDRENITFEQILSPSNLTLNWVEISPSEYSVHIKSEEDFLIVLGEMFHNGWFAQTIDGEYLKHMITFPLGWANGFYSNKSGEYQITIRFNRDKTWDMAVTVWEVTWILLLVSTSLLSSRKLVRAIKKEKKSSLCKAEFSLTKKTIKFYI